MIVPRDETWQNTSDVRSIFVLQHFVGWRDLMHVMTSRAWYQAISQHLPFFNIAAKSTEASDRAGATTLTCDDTAHYRHCYGQPQRRCLHGRLTSSAPALACLRVTVALRVSRDVVAVFGRSRREQRVQAARVQQSSYTACITMTSPEPLPCCKTLAA